MARRREAQARGYVAELIKGGESCRGDAPKGSGVVSNHLFMRISPMSEGLFWFLRGISVRNYHHRCFHRTHVIHCSCAVSALSQCRGYGSLFIFVQ